MRKWEQAAEQLQPWGSFAADLMDRITQRGLHVKLCMSPDGKMPGEDLPDTSLVEISRFNKRVYLAMVSSAPTEIPEPLQALPTPEYTNMAEIQAEQQKTRQIIDEARSTLEGLLPLKSRISDYAENLAKQEAYLKARDTMGESGRICYLQGFIPEPNLDQLREAAKQAGWGLQISEPSPNDESVPVKLRIPKWCEPIRVMFDAMGIMPGYREVDVSAWFLVFLTIFSGMIFGDAGYGLLLLGGTFAARKKWPDVSLRPFILVGMFAGATILWGALSGTWFGITTNLWAPLELLQLEALSSENENSSRLVQKLCFLLGAIHLTIAHVWNGILKAPKLNFLSEPAWILILWGNYFLAANMILGEPYSAAHFYGLHFPGILGVVIFSDPQRNVLKAFGMGVKEILLNLVNSFVDLVSYIRLYAVGVATVAVAESFNSMAADMMNGVIGFVVGILILLLGHGLNIVLAALSILVHGVRLNVLEFSQHKDLQWAGIKYNPLTKPAPATEESEEVTPAAAQA
jgi:V/A-type H+-transporting ATPase subunit I